VDAGRVASALKWAFTDFDDVTVGIDEQTLSPEDFVKVAALLKSRPMQFCGGRTQPRVPARTASAARSITSWPFAALVSTALFAASAAPVTVSLIFFSSIVFGLPDFP
jgi:hypothetical protein